MERTAGQVVSAPRLWRALDISLIVQVTGVGHAARSHRGLAGVRCDPVERKLSHWRILVPALRVGFRNSAFKTDDLLALTCSQKDLLYFS